MATMTHAPQQPAGDGGPQSEAQPILRQRGKETQPYGTLTRYPLGLGDDVRAASVEALNQILSDTMVLRDMYKKHHWQVSGPTFYSLHLLLDKHYEEQVELVDALAERVQTLGGIAIAMAHDVAETTKIERPPRGREEVPVQLSRLLEAHEHILVETRAGREEGGRARGRRDERSPRERRHPHQRDAGVVPLRAPRRHASRAGEVAPRRPRGLPRRPHHGPMIWGVSHTPASLHAWLRSHRPPAQHAPPSPPQVAQVDALTHWSGPVSPCRQQPSSRQRWLVQHGWPGLPHADEHTFVLSMGCVHSE